MWPFRKNPPPTALLERIDTLEREVKRLRLEWEETYDKVARMMGRIAKRQALADSRQDAPEPTITSAEPLDPMSAKIHAWRSRGRNVGGVA